VEPPLAKPPEMVLMVPRKGGLAGVISASGLWFLIVGLGGVAVVTGVMW